jgi:hypothetical protein
MAYTNYMPSTNQGYDYGVGVYDQQQREEEERRRREQQAAAAPVSPDGMQLAAANTGTVSDAGNLQMVGGRLQVSPNAVSTAPVEQPQAPMATNAESLRAAQNAAADQMPTAPVNPQQVQQQPAFLPEAGQFASTEQQTQDIAQSQAMDQFLAAQNDPFRLMELAKDTSQPESVRKLATDQAYRQLTNQREQSKAEEKIKNDTANGDFLSVADSIRGGRKGSEEGSWARYIMLKALDNEAAKVEGSKLGLFDTWTRATITDPVSGQQRSVQVLQSGTGKLLRGTDLQGNDLSPEDLNNAAVATNLGKHVTTTAETYIDPQGQRYSRQSDERGNIRLVNIQTGRPFAGNQNQLRVERQVNAMDRQVSQVTLDLAKKFGTNVLEAEKQYEIDQGVFGSAGNPMSREEFRAQYNFSLGQVPGVSTGTNAAPPVNQAQAPVNQAQAPVNQAQAPVTAPIAPQTQTKVSVGAIPQRRNYPSETAFKTALEDYNRQQNLNKEVAGAQAKSNIKIVEERTVTEQKPAAEARGAVEAKPIKQYSGAQDVYSVAKEINDTLPKASGGLIKGKIDDIAGWFNVSTDGAKANAQLTILGDKILKSVPRFEGPQSDRDVDAYKAAAGQLANVNTPVETRIAAFKTIVELNKKYAPDLDWSFGSGGAGTTSSGNKYKKVQ